MDAQESPEQPPQRRLTLREKKVLKGTELFRVRLIREGKLNEYKERVKFHFHDIMGNVDRGFLPPSKKTAAATLEAYRRARREFGYINADEERRKQGQFEAQSVFGQDYREYEEKERECNAAGMRQSRKQKMADVFAALPNTAPPDVEYDWIRSHPLMSKAYTVAPENREKIKVRIADIESPCNGKCPSKAALNALRRWLLAPDKFHEQRLGKHKPTAEGGGELEGSIVVDDLTEVERILAKAQAS